MTAINNAPEWVASRIANYKARIAAYDAALAKNPRNLAWQPCSYTIHGLTRGKEIVTENLAKFVAWAEVRYAA